MSVSLLERQQKFGATALSQLIRGNKIPNIAGNSGITTTLPVSLSSIGSAVTGSTLAGSVSPSSVSGHQSTAGTATSGSTTATASGGTGTGYTYTWVVSTRAGNAITANSPNSATTTFSATVNGSSDVSIGSAYCTIADSSGATVNTSGVAISLSYTGP